MHRIVFVILVIIALNLLADGAEARGRSGSRRVYHGSGKGSFYVGGR
jgi:hypothetical protein